MVSHPIEICVFGAGSWGTALALHLDRLGHRVRIWVHGKETYESLIEARENTRYLPGIPLPRKIRITRDPEEALHGARGALIAVPSKHFRPTLRALALAFRRAVLDWIVSTTKGIELATFHRMSQIIVEELTPFPPHQVVALSGPSFARELAEGKPTAVVAASTDETVARDVQHALNGGALRVYRHTDVVGVELGGALKNVIALAAGIIAGRQLGHNALAALITRGLVEMVRFGVRQGAERRTFFGLSGVGDLVLTCTGPLSRNRTVGYRLGQGDDLKTILDEMFMVVEGIPTSKAVRDWAVKQGIEMPIVGEVTRVIHEGKSVDRAVRSLLERPLKREFADEDPALGEAVPPGIS